MRLIESYEKNTAVYTEDELLKKLGIKGLKGRLLGITILNGQVFVDYGRTLK